MYILPDIEDRAMDYTVPVFPAEIFELIINLCVGTSSDHAAEATTFLRSCCLVSRYFVPLCRQRLFRNIEIGFDDNLSLTRSRLVDVVEKNPIVGSYVKSIRYIFNSEKESLIIDNGGNEISRYHLSVDDDRYPASLHNLFPNVHTLWVEHAYWFLPAAGKLPKAHSGPACPTEICVKLYRRILHDFAASDHHITSLTICQLQVETKDILSLSHLKRISSKFSTWHHRNHSASHMAGLRPLMRLEFLHSYGHGDFPAELFQYLPNLVHVELTDGYTTDIDLTVSQPTPFTSKLKNVFVPQASHLRQLLWHIPATLPLPSLSYLQIRRFEGIDGFEYLLKTLERAPNLRMLDIFSIPTYYTEPPSLPLDRCVMACRASLEYLHFENDSSYNNVYSDIIPLMCAALSAVRGVNRLKNVHLDIQLKAEEMETWMEITSPFWNTLDEIVAIDPDFPYLESVIIWVHFDSTVDVSEEQEHSQNERNWEFWNGCFTQARSTGTWDVSYERHGTTYFLDLDRIL